MRERPRAHELHHEHDQRSREDGRDIASTRLERPGSATNAASGRALSISTTHALQCFASAVSSGIHDLGGETAHATAASGFTGVGAAVPHLARVQHAFGRHDVSSVRGFVGGPAKSASDELGAAAYAVGDTVAFAESPDLFLVAHELAHVVQQRHGVHLSGGVGAEGDAYEVHANEVAAAVVRGESAEPILDRYARGGGGARAGIQRTPRPRGRRPPRRPAASPVVRTAQQLDQLVHDTVNSIAANEVGGREVAIESRMVTSSGRAASYASRTQMIANHAIGVLGHAGSEIAEAHGVDAADLDAAHDASSAVTEVWNAIVLELHAPSGFDPRLLRRASLQPADLERMATFARFRAQALARREGFPARVAAVQAALVARADAAARELAALEAHDATLPEVPRGHAHRGDPEPAPVVASELEAEPATEVVLEPDAVESEETSEVEPLLDDALDIHALRALDPLAGVTLPRDFHRRPRAQRARWFTQQRSALARARGRIDSLSDRAAASTVATELAADADVVTLGFTHNTIMAYLHDGDFNRFGEDRASWVRLALSRTPEADTTGATSSRSLDVAISSAVTAGGGNDLSLAEYDAWIRAYVAHHPTATDEQVVRAAAAHNGHSAGYPDRIWNHYRTLHVEPIESTEPPSPLRVLPLD